jgi:hypothetical protein
MEVGKVGLLNLSRKAFVSSAAAILAACSGGLRLLSNAAQQNVQTGTWRVVPPHALRDCEGATLLQLRLPVRKTRNGLISGQLLVSHQTPLRGSCELSSHGSPITIHVPVNDVSYDPSLGRDTAVVSATSGRFILSGYTGAGGSAPAIDASGPAVFRASQSYLQDLKRLGFSPRLDRVIELAFSHATINDVREIASSFPDADLKTVISFCMFGRPTADAVALKRLLPSLTASDLVSLTGIGVTPGYVMRLRSSGLSNPTVNKIRSARLKDVMGGKSGF